MAGIILQPIKFPHGRLVMTCGVDGNMQGNIPFQIFLWQSVNRHLQADWGDLDGEDKRRNDQALKDGSRLFSAYEKDGMPKIWVITEWDRSSTCILFPDEY